MSSLLSRSQWPWLICFGGCLLGSLAVARGGWSHHASRPVDAPLPPDQPVPALAAPRPIAYPITSGIPTVIDGDTLELAGTRHRLFGIDAPESSQQCRDAGGNILPVGRLAAWSLDVLISRRTIQCERYDVDKYGRSVSRCSIAGVDLNAAQVAAGWAYAYRSFTERYGPEEFSAASRRVGVWQCEELLRPWDYRKANR